jgi:hypothetical protein
MMKESPMLLVLSQRVSAVGDDKQRNMSCCSVWKQTTRREELYRAAGTKDYYSEMLATNLEAKATVE